MHTVFYCLDQRAGNPKRPRCSAGADGHRIIVGVTPESNEIAQCSSELGRVPVLAIHEVPLEPRSHKVMFPPWGSASHGSDAGLDKRSDSGVKSGVVAPTCAHVIPACLVLRLGRLQVLAGLRQMPFELCRLQGYGALSSWRRRISLTTPGFALPRVAFITWPVRKPMACFLPSR